MVLLLNQDRIPTFVRGMVLLFGEGRNSNEC